MDKRNAPGRAKTEGVECRFSGDSDAISTVEVRLQFLEKLGLPLTIAGVVAGLAFGGVRP
jgi:hypothetical protein